MLTTTTPPADSRPSRRGIFQRRSPKNRSGIALLTPEIDPPDLPRPRDARYTLRPPACRVSELIGLKIFEIDTTEGVLRVMGKGAKERLVPLGENSARLAGALYARSKTLFCSRDAVARRYS